MKNESYLPKNWTLQLTGLIIGQEIFLQGKELSTILDWNAV